MACGENETHLRIQSSTFNTSHKTVSTKEIQCLHLAPLSHTLNHPSGKLMGRYVNARKDCMRNVGHFSLRLLGLLAPETISQYLPFFLNKCPKTRNLKEQINSPFNVEHLYFLVFLRQGLMG